MSALADIRLHFANAGKPGSDATACGQDGRLPVGRLHPVRSADWRTADAGMAILVLAVVVILSNVHRMPNGVAGFLEMRLSLKNALLIGAFAWIWPVVLSACGLYAPSRLRSGHGEWPRLAIAGLAGCALAMVFPLTGKSDAVTPMTALLLGVTLVPVAGLARVSVRAMERRRSNARPRQVVLIGSGPRAAELYGQLVADADRANHVIGFVDSAPHTMLTRMGVMHLGGIQDLEQILMHRVVDDVLIGLPVKSHYDEIRQSLAACAWVGVPASYSADLFGRATLNPDQPTHAAPVMSMSATPSRELLAVKRLMDVLGALGLLVALSPLMLAVATAVKLSSPGPVLFTQYRYGHMKRLFRMYKFRTMSVGAEALQDQLENNNEASGPVFKIRNDPRITPFGRFLRKRSLDELPQIWNVLMGDMSLVGPRPLPIRDVGKFDEPRLMRRFSMRPGLTCLWQISGRSNLGFDHWIVLDLEYIDRWSIGLDLAILFRTVPAVLRGAGAT